MADQDFKDFADQFKQMHDDLDKLAKATAVQTEETKEQSKETKEQTEVFKKETKERAKETKTQNKETKTQTETFKKETKVQNQTTKDNSKDRKSILKAMQLQLRKTQMEQGASMSDVAAEHMAGGGGVGGAISAAAGHRIGQFKHKYDPLNLVKKITGGSKLATVLAGKIMRRDPKKIREFADLAPSESGIPTSFFGKSSSQGGGGGRMGGEPSAVSSEKSLGFLESMSVSLTTIIEKVTNLDKNVTQLEEYGKEGTELARKQERHLEEMKDSAALERGRFQKKSPTPTQTKTQMPADKEQSPLLDKIMGWLKDGFSWFMGHLKTIGGLFVTLLAPLKLLKSVAYALFDGLMTLVKFISRITGVSGLASKGLEAAKGAGSAIKSALGIGSKIAATGAAAAAAAGSAPAVAGGAAKAAGAVAGKSAPAVAKAVSGSAIKEAGPKAAGAVAGKSAPAVAKAVSGSAIKEAIKEAGPKVLGGGVLKGAAKALPLVGIGFALKNLYDGDYTQAAIDAAMGLGSVPALLAPGAGSAAIFTTGMAATIANQAYKAIYGLEPLSDPLVKERMPELVEGAKDYVADYLSPQADKENTAGPTAVAEGVPAMGTEETPDIMGATGTVSTPTELAAPQSQTGAVLSQAQEFQRNAAMTPQGGSGGAATIINNVKNNNSSVTNLQQTMPDPRSGETSYLRSLDRHFAPS